MKLEAIFQAIDEAEIKRYCDEQQEEHLHLEFKTVNHPYSIEYDQKKGKDSFTKDDAKNADKKNISKTLSGFANANGGIVIWGIKAQEDKHKPDVAEKLVPIKELTKFLTLLNRLESESVTPPIDGVIHTKIDIGDDSGYVKTFVPPSENAPHMANYADKHYYKRSGGNFYQCEHYDIIDIFSRRKSPKIGLSFKMEINKYRVYLPAEFIPGGISTPPKKTNDYKLRAFLHVSAMNEGKVYVKYLNCFLDVPVELINQKDYEGNRIFEKNGIRYISISCSNFIGHLSAIRHEPILPGTSLGICRISLHDKLFDSLKGSELHYQVHADNGEVNKGDIKLFDVEKFETITENLS